MDLKEIALNKNGQRHPWETIRIKVITDFIQEITDYKNREIKILDVGSGDIYLIKQLSKFFPEAVFFAVDIGYDDKYLYETNKSLAEEKINIKVFNSLPSAEKEIGNIDLILLLDVIEHVPDDIGFLRTLAASSKVKNETLFLITVPAYQALFCSHDSFLGHYRRYTNTLLKKHISEANLQVINSGYFFAFPIIPRILQKIKEIFFPTATKVYGIGNWNGNRMQTKLLEWMLWKDFKISRFLRSYVKIKLPGLSNFAVCKKYV